jgi:predicted esterase
MDRACWRRRWKRKGAFFANGGFGAWLSLALLMSVLYPGRAFAGEVAIVPSSDGRLGAWLALGPIAATSKGNRAPRNMETSVLAGGEESALTGRFGRSVPIVAPEGDADAPTTASWKVISSASGPIDVAASLNLKGGESFAFLYGVLHLSESFKGLLLLGSSDGARVWIDKKMVSSSDWFRPERDDEDAARLELTAGDHPIVIKLHHRDAYWAVRVRLVDMAFAPAHGFLRLPGTGDAEARSLAQRMTDIEVDRGLTPDGFVPTVSVGFYEGLPRGTDRFVRVAAAVKSGGRTRRLYAFDGGEVPLDTGPSRLKLHLPPIPQQEIGEEITSGELVISVEVAGRKLDAELKLRPFMLQAAGAAQKALATLSTINGFAADPAVTRATIELLRDRFARHVGAGDTDLETLGAEAQTIMDYAADVEARRDPLRAHAGIRRFAYRSPLDGELSPFGLYVPKSYVDAPAAGKTYPLVIVLHGLNGKPLSMMKWFFGRDQQHDPEWEDRRIAEVEPIEGFVLAPNAHGNAMYRELGELDVVKLLDWVTGVYPIDPNRVTITGASMGGTGTAAIAFHYPDRFAAAEPLCGYHSYFIRKDVTGFGMWPWEKLLSEYRSPVSWAENGLYLPLYVWQGRRDYPWKNSTVLVDRYKELGYSVEYEQPDIGHDVWRKAYDQLLGFKWLSQKTRTPHKKRILFKTDSPRYGDDAWVHLREISTDLEFATIDANVVDKTEIEVATHGVDAFALDRDPELVSSTAPTRVKIDGALLEFAPDVPIAAYRGEGGGAWKPGLKAATPGRKRAGLSGPMRDAFFEPLVFVYGTGDPAQTRANRDTARAWARIKWGVDIHYPIIADTELDESTAETHSLVLVGNADSNRVVRDLEPQLPFKVGQGSISATIDGSSPKEWRGKDLGVAFIYPNPKHPSRYVLVLEGTSPLGTFRSIALPELLPDFMVFDERIALARGQIVLGNGTPLAAGLFRSDWSLGKVDLPRQKVAQIE